MDKEMQEMFELIINKIDNQDKVNSQKFEKIDDQFRNLKLYIENNVKKRIDALFDGYKLNHEKQWELEKKYDSLNNKVETLQSEFYALKKKVG